jgi:alkaline phosphatase D
MVAFQGVEQHDDGPLFFAGPAAAAFWQRWFEGQGKLKNMRNDDPNTGDFIDTFGNKMRVLAVANPKLSYREFADSNKSWGNFLSDHLLKSEGYGIIKVDHKSKEFVLECWSTLANPKTDKQYAGWPVRHPFKRT